MRTTIDIEDPILKEVKRLQRREGKSLGHLMSEPLAQALDGLRETPADNAAVPLDRQADGHMRRSGRQARIARCHEWRQAAVSFGIDVDILLYASAETPSRCRIAHAASSSFAAASSTSCGTPRFLNAASSRACGPRAYCASSRLIPNCVP